MQIVIDIDENVFARLFDNGIEDYEIVNDDLFTIAKSIRNCTPLSEEPCKDTISRQAVLHLINEDWKYEGLESDVANLPPVKPIRPRGHWIHVKVGKLFPGNDYKCSECGNVLDFNGVNCGRGDANYCPNCGADMRGEQE